jgi:hypothetical protein
MGTSSRLGVVAKVMACLALASCAQVDSEDELGLQSSQQSLVDTENGLRTINGLRTVNGLRSFNGLTTTNGLRTINGLRTMNGLVTRNGLRTFNGLTVDCTGKTAAACTGSPDGLLSNTTGMLSSDEGIMTASYLVRCALDAGTSIAVKDYTGSTLKLSGEIGLAPEWKEGQCSTACEEKISACLMALTNGEGQHVELEMTAPFDDVGVDNSSAFPYQEAAFFGNVFSDPPQAFYCIGKDYAVVSSRSIEHLATRACKGYTDKFGECPYVRAGLCNPAASSTEEGVHQDYMCFDTKKTLRKCRDRDGGDRKWLYPITTFRNVR